MTADPEHYITLFDSTFLPQGLALHSSLRRHQPESVLWVLCMDEETYEFLDNVEFAGLRLIKLDDIETPQLRALRQERSTVEYCWTLTPLTPKLVFDRDKTAMRVTYVDADMYFLADPTPLFHELDRSNKSVLITEHAYDPEYDRSHTVGRYCVQFTTFVRTRSEPIRARWQAQCEEWCFARSEDGKFGDQKYLDDWPDRFGDEVHVLQEKGALLAPWNARRYPFSEAIAWHFHGLRTLGKGWILMHRGYEIPQVVERYVYMPYLKELSRQLDMIGHDVVQADGNPFGYWAKYAFGRLVQVIVRIAGLYMSRIGKVARL